MSMRQANRRVRKSIAIIGEGLTEYRYVDDMRTTERYRFSLVPGIPKHSDIDDIVNMAKERVNAGYDYVLCLRDMDVIESSHDKMSQLGDALNKAVANGDRESRFRGADELERYFNETGLDVFKDFDAAWFSGPSLF